MDPRAVPQGEEPVVVCTNLVKIYQVDELEVIALQGLDLDVRRGEILAVVGASGSGKSSLLNILGGLDRPTAGRVTVAGQDLLKLSEPDLTRYRLDQVGFVWQQSSRNLLPYLTALENVELPMLAAGVPAPRARERAADLLEAVELTSRRDHRLAQLSGGQQQRIAIAVALANRPRLLLADEPTGEVDSATAHHIWQLVRNLNRQHDLTTIIVTHDADIARFVDRVVSIADGKTSTETVRRQTLHPPDRNGAPGSGPRPPRPEPEEHPPRFEERTVLDGAGRMQIPRDYLEQRGIRNRAVVQLVEDGILIRKADGDERPHGPGAAPAGPASTPTEEEPTPTEGRRWWRRLRRRREEDAGRPEQGSVNPNRVEASSPDLAHLRRFHLTDYGPQTPLVRAWDLERVYRVGNEAIHALRSIDLVIPARRFTVFRGRSGSGKTTLLNLISGLDQPTAGRVELFGQDLAHLSAEERTQMRQDWLGFVFQSFALLPTFSARENVELLLRAAGMDENARRERSLHCLALVGLEPWADHRPFELSGGQQQRLSIARALARSPALLIADEPTSDLDSETGSQVLRLFRRLVDAEGITVLMASHDPASAAHATDLYELSDGAIVDYRSLEEATG